MTTIIIREETGPGVVINDGSPAAYAAATRAEAAAAAAEAVGATNDAIIAGRINTPGSATRVALDGTIGDVVDASRYLGKCHLWMGFGQSNIMLSGADYYPIGLQSPDPRVMFWDGSDIIVLDVANRGAQAWAAWEFAKSLPAGEWVLIVNPMEGGIGFTTTSLAVPPPGTHSGPGTLDWQLTTDPNNKFLQLVDETIDARAAALTLGASEVEHTVFISAGEADANYLDEFGYTWFLSNGLFQLVTQASIPVLYIVVGSMVPEWVAASTDAHVDTVARVLAQTVFRNSKSAFVYGPEGMAKPGEEVHYSTPGAIERGKAWAEAARLARANHESMPSAPPRNLRARRDGAGNVVADWDAPYARIAEMEVEASIDGGAFGAETPFGESQQRVIVAVTDAESVVIRVRYADETPTWSAWATVTSLPIA